MADDQPTPKTTTVAKYEDPARPGSSIELAPQAWALAQRVATTEFVPKGLRGKPEAVLACILYGREAGIGEMQALNKIHVVDGRPGMAAELMRALVLQHGHELWAEELSSTRCTVAGKRRNSERETRVTWTLDDAKRAGLVGKDNWKKYPGDMLFARATAKLCRALFPDVLAGLSYTLEELADGDAFDVHEAFDGPAPGTRAATPKETVRARQAATRGAEVTGDTEPAAVEPTASPEAPLPGEDDEIADAEIVDDDEEDAQEAPEAPEAPSGDDDPSETPEPPEEPAEDGYEGPDEHIQGRAYSGPQLIAMKFGDAGVTDRAERLAVVSDVVGRPVESSKELTTEEIHLVLGAFEAGMDPKKYVAELPAGVVDGFRPAPAEAPKAPAEAPKPTRRRATPTPGTWDEDAWRKFLAARGLKVSELVRTAQHLCREADGETPLPTTLTSVVGVSYADDLVNALEDLALEKNASPGGDQ